MLKLNNSFAPFMGENKSLSVGLNPLGFRTASEQLFTTLLPGMNVVTLRIRYYSFYCWLLKRFYAKRANANDAELRRHLRMSELLMALIHAQSSKYDGVPGITRALEIINRGDGTIDFNEDAMPEGKDSGGYWKGPYGAFGTYYAASLQEMSIISTLAENNRLLNVTPWSEHYISGDELADAFADTIGEDFGDMFEACAQSGIVTRDQLAEMESAFQSHYLSDNEERMLLQKMLIQKDKPSSEVETTFRKETLKLLLFFIQDTLPEKFSELDFARYAYHRFKDGKENNLATVGWYAYYLNDSRQFEALKVFPVLLKRLRDSKKPGQWEKIDVFSAILASEVVDAMGIKDDTLKSMFERWDKIVEPKEKMANSFYIIFDDYVKNNTYQDFKHNIRMHFRSVSNDVFDSFYIIESHLEDSVVAYIQRYLTEDIIYNHYSEAMRKFSQNGIPTQKLIIENGYVRGLELYDATHSSPRIVTLLNYATDLGLVRANNLTANGIGLLKKLEQ